MAADRALGVPIPVLFHTVGMMRTSESSPAHCSPIEVK